MPQSLFHGNSAGGVQLKHLHAEIQTHLVERFEVGFRIDSLEFGEGRLEIREVILIE